MALPKFPTNIPGTINSFQFLPLASAPAVAGPPTFAFDATKISWTLSFNTFLPTQNITPRCTAYRMAK